MNANTCPICEKVLEKDDLLISKYIPEYNWWVVYHLKNGQDISTDKIRELRGGHYCGQARFDIVYKGLDKVIKKF